MDTIQKFGDIECFVFDMDGVLTDGKLYISDNNEIGRTSHMRDGYSIQKAINMGYNIIIISGAESDSYKLRLEKLGVFQIHMGVKDKAEFLKTIVDSHNLGYDHILYMGDDMPDVDAMKLCHLKACPADACIDIKMIADYISPYDGGQGCVRDVIEKVLRARGHWS